MKWALIFWISFGSGFSSGWVKDGGEAVYDTKDECMEQLNLIKENAKNEDQEIKILYCRPVK